MQAGDPRQPRRGASSEQLSPDRTRGRYGNTGYAGTRGALDHTLSFSSSSSGYHTTSSSRRGGHTMSSTFFPSSTGGLSASHSRSASTMSPMRFSSPSKRFGYMRWPPLISPTSELLTQVYDDYADVRLEVESIGHNLTSVMMNPRDASMSDLDPGGVDHQATSVVPAPMPSVNMAEVSEFMRRTSRLHDRYRRNHHHGLPLFRSQPASQRNDGGSDLAECFRLVPAIFFSRDFDLRDPMLFDRLVVSASPDTQERLGLFLDSVESCLLKQISSRSREFFDALTTLQDVRGRVAQACNYVHRLRSGLQDMDRNTVIGMIRIPRLAQRKVNHATLLEKLKLMAEVQRCKDLVSSLLSSEDYMGALDVVEDARSLLADSLSGVHCMRKLERQLADYLELVTELMGTSFINLAVTLHGEEVDESRGPAPPPPLDGHENGAPNGQENGPSNGPKPQLPPSTQALLVPRLCGLVRLCRLSKVLEKYRTRLTDSLKVIVKTVVLEYLDMGEYGPDGEPHEHTGGSGEVEESSRLSARVRAMEPQAFLECLSLCLEQLLLPMQRVSLVHAFLEHHMGLQLLSLLHKHKVEEDRLSSPHRSPTKQGVDPSDAPSSPSPAPPPSSSPNPPGPSQPVPLRDPLSPSQPSASTKFRAFLDKRRFDNTIAPAARAYREEDQIKVLELQACKRLNDEILKSLCDLAQRHVSSLLVIRREAHVNLTLTEMKTLWDTTFRFLSAIDTISGTGGFGLKSTLLTQAKLFVEHSHEAFMASLVEALEGERWTQADVSPQRQAELDRLTSGKAVRPSAVPASDIVGPASGVPANADAEGQAAGGAAVRRASSGTPTSLSRHPSSGDTRDEDEATRKRKKEPAEAVVDETRFKVVWSVLLLVEMVLSYLNLAANFPVLTVDVVQRVVDLFRFFNARTTQLVLGAGAINSAARLRSITAKHLALASQCLALVMVLLPHVRAALSAHLPPKQQPFLAELDRIKQEYAEHQEKILAKFVSIIGELVANSAATSLKETDWDNLGSTSCRFIEDVIKGTSTMHRVLQQHLPAPQIQEVFSRIFDLLSQRFREYFEDVKPSTTAGRQRLVDEVSHLVTSLSMLRGVSAQALKIDEYMRAKYNIQ